MEKLETEENYHSTFLINSSEDVVHCDIEFNRFYHNELH